MAKGAPFAKIPAPPKHLPGLDEGERRMRLRVKQLEEENRRLCVQVQQLGGPVVSPA